MWIEIFEEDYKNIYEVKFIKKHKHMRESAL